MNKKLIIKIVLTPIFAATEVPTYILCEEILFDELFGISPDKIMEYLLRKFHNKFIKTLEVYESRFHHYDFKETWRVYLEYS
jgi:hypothetical protein